MDQTATRVGEDTTLRLAGEARAGTPERIRYVLPEGRTRRLWCNAEQLSDVAVLRLKRGGRRAACARRL